MKISIITATFNSGRFIENAIKSVQQQDYPDIEHIIVDGQSSDNTINIIEKNMSGISKFISEPDNGIYDALNKGIGLACGDVIGFLHSDDVFYSNHTVSHIAEKFSDSALDSVYGDLLYVNEQTDKTVRYWKSGDFNSKKLKRGWMPPHPTFYVKKKIYVQHGLFDTSYRISADYDLILRFLGKCKISTLYIPEVLVMMRQGGISNRNLKNIFIKSSEDFKAIRKNGIGNCFTIISKNLSKIPQFLIGNPRGFTGR